MNSPTRDYLIFARTDYPKPLEYIGTLLDFPTGAGRPELERRARAQFGGAGWVEMVALPAASVVQVIPIESDRVE